MTESIAALADDLWQYAVERQPYLRLRTGATVEKLPANSLDEAADDAAYGSALTARLAQVDTADLTDAERLTHAFIADQAGWLEEAEALWWTSFPVTPYALFMYGYILQQVLPPAREEPERFAALVADVARSVRVLDDKVAAMADRGWVLPAPAFDGALSTLRGLRAAFEGVLGEDGAAVTAAFEQVLARLEDPAYRSAAPERVGLSIFPGGEEAYERLVRYHLTFAADPREIHQRGLQQIEELNERKAKLRAELGYPDEGAFVGHLRQTGRLHARSAEEVEASYRRHVARIEPLISQWFSRIPKAPYDVERLEPALEAGMSYGYYEPPTSQNPVGRYRYNGSGLDSRSQLNAATLIFHELVPGHHFHVAAQGENEDLPLIRRHAITLNVFNEGWAEYAAAVAGEMGLYDDPYDEYGRLAHESFLASRLVVDPGLNVLGWPLERARDFMRTHCMEAETQIATETLRYATDLPGQGLAYRVGHGFITDLREEARHALGARFDIRAFHEAILGPGALPLHVLADHVDRWIAAQAA